VRNQASKIVSILDLNTDVVFLSGTKLNGKDRQLADGVRMKYKLHHNSVSARRGVAILLSNNLDFEILDEARDGLENLLLLLIRIKGETLVLGAVYGPNTNEFSTYTFLQEVCLRWREYPVLLGGTGMQLILSYLLIIILMYFLCVPYLARLAPNVFYSFVRNLVSRIHTGH